MKKRNPILDKKFAEGHKAGYNKGVEVGVHATAKTVTRLVNELAKEKGIGEKTLKIIKEKLKV